MGKYFQFINLTRQTESTVALPFNFGMPWAKDLHRMATDDLCKHFDFVLEQNKWATDEQVVAIGEDGSVIYMPDTCRLSSISVDGHTSSANILREESIGYEAEPPKMNFSDYYKLNLPADEIAQILNVSYQRRQLDLPQTEEPLVDLEQLAQRLQQNLIRIAMYNETARREFLIAPILAQLLDYVDLKMRIEHPLHVNDQLNGILDYYLTTTTHMLVIEAKNGDLQRGFHQLMAEMVAVDRQQVANGPKGNESTTIYGAVTVGDIWQFGDLNRSTQTIVQDINLYTIPKQVEQVMRTLVAVLKDT